MPDNIVEQAMQEAKSHWIDVRDETGTFVYHPDRLLAAFEKIKQHCEEIQKSHQWSAMNKGKIELLDQLINEVFEPIYSESRTPIVELPDENGKMIPIYEGYSYWFVSLHFELIKFMREKDFRGSNRSFATEAAALKYIRENKTIYSEDVVRQFIDAAFALYRNEITIMGLHEALRKIEDVHVIYKSDKTKTPNQ